MNIGILTFSAAHNFGAALQCYALYKTICDLGHNVSVIDYRPDYLATYEPKFGLRNLFSRHFVSLYSRWSNYRYWRHIYDGYANFESHNMQMTKPCVDLKGLKDIVDTFDYVVVGSDQVWNPKFNGNDDAWYGFSDVSTQWIAYAASAGNADNIIAHLAEVGKKTDKFKAISVREDALRQVLKTVSYKDIQTVLDPVLLADPSVWQKWNRPIINEKYIVTYQARESDDVFRIAREISKQLGDIKIVPLDFYDNVEKNGLKTHIASPSDFISLIRNASCVVTTSFHGTAFSIINKVPFYTLRLNDGADDRSENLLRQLGLENRMIDLSCNITFNSIDYTDAEQQLHQLRRHSMDFLRHSLL